MTQPGRIRTAIKNKNYNLTAWGFLKKKDITRCPTKSGVYALYYGTLLQYIGSSEDIRRRVPEHNFEIPFGSFAWYRLPPSQMLKAEEYLIGRYKPPWNSQHV